MFYLLATIFLNVVLSAVLKLYPRYNIDTLQAIVTNYCVCVVTGCLFLGHIPFSAGTVHTTWFPWAVLTGAAFICIFNLIAYCTRIDGITTTTIANKLSLVIPVVFSFILYHELAGIWKIVGIVLAFPAVYLTSRVKGEDNKVQSIFWPAALFIMSGLSDTLLNYMQYNFLPTADVQSAFTITLFATAACIGIVLVGVLLALGRKQFHVKNIVAGICLGIPNYFSIYFLIRALNSNALQSSAMIPVINIGILVASSLMAIVVFREKTNVLRITGLVLSVLAILLIAFGDK